MAIVFTELTGATTTTDASTIVAASIAVTINVPILVLVGNTKGTNADTPTVTDDAAGGTNTYTSIRTRGWGSSASLLRRCTAFSMIPKATENIVITVAFGGGTQTALYHSVVQAAGAATTGTIVQSVGNFNDSTANDFNGLLVLATFGATGNMGVTLIGTATSSAMTKDAASTLIRTGSVSTPTVGFLAEYSDNTNLTPTATWGGGGAVCGGLAFEVKAAAAGTMGPRAQFLSTMMQG